jgi:MoaA/NifB/PqqE/SkfB family radical SAM enzyme
VKAYARLPGLVLRGLLSSDRPLLAHLVVTRRCNLNCAYCNEYDHASHPVLEDVLAERIEHLARLRTAMVACTGGEPLLHPNLDQVVREIRSRGMTAMLSTNGHLLTRERIESLNDAGLDVMQISIDNLEPDAVSAKSLSLLDDRLRLLARVARFDVNVNSVMGPGSGGSDALEIARRAAAYGHSHSVGFAHDSGGAFLPLSGEARSAYRAIGRSSNALLHGFNHWLFQRHLVQGRSCAWRCRAGARFLYVDELGRVCWCSQRRDRPATPLCQYGLEDIRRSFRTEKTCAPYCTLNCVHHVGALDGWRRQPIRDPRTPEPRT